MVLYALLIHCRLTMRELPGLRLLLMRLLSMGLRLLLMRLLSMGPRLLLMLADGIDVDFGGYFEALLPALCAARGFSLAAFAPELIGAVSPVPTKQLRLVEEDVKSGVRLGSACRALEPGKLYHPVKV